MARSFASASSQYLYYDGAVHASWPLAVSAWVYPLQDNVAGDVFAITDHDTTSGACKITLNSSGKAVAYSQSDGGAASGSATSVNSYTANAWNHVVGLWWYNTMRIVWLNGDIANRGENTANCPPDPGFSRTSLGARVFSNTAGQFFNGYIGPVAVWAATATDGFVTRLYNGGIGLDPRCVAPSTLVAYWPLLNNDGDQDYWGNFHLTASGSPTYAKHPPVLMRSRPKYVVIGAASGAPTISSVTITGTRTVSNTLAANVVTNPVTVDSIAYQWEIADDGSGTNAADLSGETSQTLALTYADFASRLDANGEAYVRVGAIATVGVDSSAESFSDWVRVTAGGSGVVRPIGQSVYISV